MERIERIARIISAKAGDNPLDEFYDFYIYGKRIVQVVRKINEVANGMGMEIEAYMTNISKLDECLSYFDENTVKELDTENARKQYDELIASIKTEYDRYEHDMMDDSIEDKSLVVTDMYFKAVASLLQYSMSYEESCENKFRNRYSDDEKNVRMLLDEMHDAGNYVMNMR